MDVPVQPHNPRNTQKLGQHSQGHHQSGSLSRHPHAFQRRYFYLYQVPGVFSDGIFDIPYAVWFSIPSLLLLIYMIYNIAKGTKPYFTTIFNLYAFVVVVTWITLVVGVLINLVELLQLLTNINSVFLGLTVFAGASSIGDYISIVTFAKRGFSSTAVSGIFSGQLLNFLIGFGIAIIINSLNG